MFFLPDLRRLVRPALIASLVVLPAIGLILLQNKQATGSWTTLPYMLSRYQYGVPTTFTFQPVPIPHRLLTREQQLDYDAQSEAHGAGTDTFAAYWTRWVESPPFLSIFSACRRCFSRLPAFLLALREYRFVWAAATVLIFSLGTNFYPYFYSHYIAALTCLFILIAVVGLERLSQWSQRIGARILMLLSLRRAFHLLVRRTLDARLRFVRCSNAATKAGTPSTMAIPKAASPSIANSTPSPASNWFSCATGRSINFSEWVHNAADIDRRPHRLGSRSWPGRESKAAALLSRSHGVAAGTGRAASRA